MVTTTAPTRTMYRIDRFHVHEVTAQRGEACWVERKIIDGCIEMEIYAYEDVSIFFTRDEAVAALRKRLDEQIRTAHAELKTYDECLELLERTA